MLNRFSHVWLFATPWTIACQAPLYMEFSRQEYWSRLPLPFPGYLPNPGIEPISVMSYALRGGFFSTSATWEVNTRHNFINVCQSCLLDAECVKCSVLVFSLKKNPKYVRNLSQGIWKDMYTRSSSGNALLGKQTTWCFKLSVLGN